MKRLMVAMLAGCVMLSVMVDATWAGDAKAKGDAAVDTLKVVARLIEIPGTFPPNDLYNYVYIMKYR
ncbi:MAG: hypothetical protein GF331_18265, partial [Chitinivibrionales bacterium]|nr:hypothetical protein [Chitinivibrionales bacterium]